MVFHSLADGAQGAYFNQVQLRLTGVTDAGALGQAWQRVVDRHPVLRSRVAWDGVDQPVQVVHARRHRAGRLSRTGATSTARPNCARCSPTTAPRASTWPSAPLLRVVIATARRRRGADGLDVPPRAAGRLERGTGLRRGVRAVRGDRRGAAAVPARAPFREYLALAGRQDVARAREYWRGALAGVDGADPLPFDRPAGGGAPRAVRHVRSNWRCPPTGHTGCVTGPALRSDREHRRAGRLGAAAGPLQRRARRRVRHHRVRPARRPARRRVHGRHVHQHRADPAVRSRAVSMLDWLRESAGASRPTARRFDFVPLAQLQGWSEVDGGANLFDSILVFENYPFDTEALSAHGIGMHETRDLQPTNYPLSAVVHPGDELAVSLDYDPDPVRRRPRSSGWPLRLRLLLDHMAENLDRPVGELAVLTDTEQDLVPRSWNDTATPAAVGHAWPSCSPQQVHRTPDIVAVEAGGLSPDLRGAGPPGERTGGAAGRCSVSATEQPVGAAAGAVARRRGGRVGRAEGRWRLSATGPAGTRGADARGTRRRRRDRAAHRRPVGAHGAIAASRTARAGGDPRGRPCAGRQRRPRTVSPT